MRSSMFTFKIDDFFDLKFGMPKIGDIICDFLPSLVLRQRIPETDDTGEMEIYTAPSLTLTVKHYPNDQMIALNIDATETFEGYKQKFNNAAMAELKKKIEELIGIEVERIPLIKRNNPVPLYFMSSDDRVLEYDFDEIKYHGQSKFQDVKILHSPSLGNTLILDELQNLAEEDLAYTRGLMKFGVNSYKDKEILILGGGDGGLLHELLEENPKFVTMVDIDGTVMEQCQKYLKGACGSCLDTFDGPNYKIIVDDCLVYLKKYQEEGRKFDFVFNDLTDIPIGVDSKDVQTASSKEQNESWHFVEQILELSLPLLNDTGRYLNHAIGVGCRAALADYEKLLQRFGVKYTRHSAFVPSFMEDWVFYELSKN